MITRTFGIATVLFALGLPGTVYAQETEASGISIKTYVKASSAALQITTAPIQALSPTTVHCPGKCALEIRLDTQVNGLTPGDPNVVAVVTHVDGSGSEIAPNSVLGIDSTSVGGGSNARSFTWLAANIGPGKHRVEIFMYVPEGTAASANRTLTVQVLAADKEVE